MQVAAYPMMQTRVAGLEMQWPAALINVYEQSGVKISGEGTIVSCWLPADWLQRSEDEGRPEP